MEFNFKEALESLDYSQIIESKAEDFLKYVISRLKEKNIGFTDIGEMYFVIMKKDKAFSTLIEYDFYVSYKTKTELNCDKNENHRHKSITSAYYKVYNREDAISIITVIENELKDEGLVCIDTTETDKITDYDILKSIKITF